MSERYLTRPEAAEHLTSRGIHISKNTLQKYASLGGGPTYRRFGTRTLYTVADLDRWVDEKLSEPMASASREAETA